MTTAKEIIDKAKELIEQDGWIQGSYRRSDKDGKCTGRCLSGALRDAALELGLLGPEDFLLHAFAGPSEYMEARELVASKLGGASLPSWNDKKGSKEAVLEVLTL